jgi:GTPase SAR1 family protein
VTYQEGADLARRLQSLFVECSAKTKIGVEEAFEELVTKVKKKKERLEGRDDSRFLVRAV